MRSLVDVVYEQLLVFLTYTVAFMLGYRWTWDLLNRKVFFVRHVLIPILIGLAIYPIHPPITYAILLALTFWSIILLAEVIMNEYRENKFRQLDMETTHSPDQRDKIVVHPTSAIPICERIYNVRYHPVTICDTSVLEDPFWPDHISTIFTVEQKRRNMIWTTIRIWQVSLLNGGKKIVHQFHRFWPRTDGEPFTYSCYARSNVITSFQSCGVIFIVVHQIEDHAKNYALLHVYDTKFKKSAVYETKLLSQEIGLAPINSLISITCLGRLVGVNGSVDGWRIRMLSVTSKGITFRVRVINQMFELRQDVRQIMNEEILFAQSALPYRVRTSRGHFGVCANTNFAQEPQPPLIFFNEITSDFVIFRSFNDLILMDARFVPWPDVRFRYYEDRCFPDRDGWCYPVFTNDRETIRLVNCGCVLRTEFRTSSLAYRAAKSIFQGNPRLRYQLDAEGFRQATGTPGMHGHFG